MAADEPPTPTEAADVVDEVADRLAAGAHDTVDDAADDEDDGVAAWQEKLAQAHISPQAHAALADSRSHLDGAWTVHDPSADVQPAGRLRHVRQAAMDAMEGVTHQQVGFNREIVVAVDRLTRVVEELSTRLEVVDALEQRTDEGLGRTQAGVATAAVQIDDLAGELAEVAATLSTLLGRVDALEVLTADQRQVLGAARTREELVLRTLQSSTGAGVAPALADEAAVADAALLRRIAAAGRPGREVLVAWARAVAPVITEAATGAPVLDLDPDRGEWLDVWAELDVIAKGADADPLRAQALVERGHDVVGADPVAHLGGLADGSVGAVTASVLADVRPLGELVAVVDQAVRVLRPGGVLVLAAARPGTTATEDLLWADPRRRPLHPEALALLALERGFAEAQIVDLPDPADPDAPARAYALVARAARRTSTADVTPGRRAGRQAQEPSAGGAGGHGQVGAQPLESVGSTSALRIAILKPDVGVAGGFERVASRVEASLRRDGHEVTRLSVDMPARPRPIGGVPVSDDVWRAAPEYFRYLAGVEAFDDLGTAAYDLVISTQPPSFTHRHPRHLSLFFHHHRVFYDLEDVWIAGGFAPDPDLHRRAGERIRALDQPRLDAVRWYAAGSETVRRRLGHFNGIDRVSLFHAGIAVGRTVAEASQRARAERHGPVLCVGRLEFPKRPELLVAAMRRLPHVPAVLVGSGGRSEWVRTVDHRLSRPGVDLDAVDETALWCCRADPAARAPRGWSSNVEVAGRVDDETLERLYATTPCVVAPALDEDYGLTAIEAMAHGAPVVVCEDGGGLADLVEDEVDGLVVAPTGAAIAAAVERILGDDDLASSLAAGARLRASRTTWARADRQIRTAVAITMDEAAPESAA